LNTQPQQEANPLESLVTLRQMQDALKNTVLPVNSQRPVFFGDIATTEMLVMQVLDEKTEKPTGETYPAALLTLSSGYQIEVTPDEYKDNVRPLINLSIQISHYTVAFVAQLFNQMFQPVQPEPQTATENNKQ
jgi:hypothetical protein